jgi:hypothetical protein
MIVSPELLQQARSTESQLDALLSALVPIHESADPASMDAQLLQMYRRAVTTFRNDGIMKQRLIRLPGCGASAS